MKQLDAAAVGFVPTASARTIEDGGSFEALARELTAMATGKPPATVTSKPVSEIVPRRIRPRVVCLADVAPRRVRWLWEPYLPIGMLSMLSGDPGAGKSFLALALCADLTNGIRRGRSVQRVAPVNVLYMTRENPLAECIRPRFDCLGGNPSRFFALDGTDYEGEDGREDRGPINLSDVALLDDAIGAYGARLIVVDPIQSYFGAGVDLHRSNETRPVMDSLAKLAEKHDCAFLLVRHLSKQTGGKAIHRGLGSIDLTGAVRSELLAGCLPDDPESRALVHSKTNIGPVGRTLGYTISGDENGEAQFIWTGESMITAADLLAAPSGPGEKSALDEAKEWLTGQLRGGSRNQRELEGLAKDGGIKPITLRRAREELRIKPRKAGMAGGWLWSLPEDAHEDAHTKNMSTFGRLITLEDDQPTAKMINLRPLKEEDDQENCVRVRNEHLRALIPVPADGGRLPI